MFWHTISRERIAERLGDAAVALFLLVALLVTGCELPGRADRDAQRTVERPQPVAAQEPTITYAADVAETAISEAAAPAVPASVTYDEAESLFRDGRYDDAYAYFGVYVETRPENVWGRYMLGLSASRAGRTDEAIAAFEYALDLDPTHVKTLLNLSRVLLRTDHPEDALARIQDALVLDPGSADGFRLLGLARVDLGRTLDAADAFFQALALDEQDVWSMNNLGLLRIREGDFTRAVPPLARAVELAPGQPVFQNNLGIALERLGYFTAATDAYRAALAGGSEYAKAERNLARTVDRPDREGLVPFDLAAFADEFVRELRVGDVAPEEADTVLAEPAPIPVPVPDTIPAIVPDTVRPSQDTLRVDTVSVARGVPAPHGGTR